MHLNDAGNVVHPVCYPHRTCADNQYIIQQMYFVVYLRCNNYMKMAHMRRNMQQFNLHGSVYRKNILIYMSNKMQRYTVYFIWKLLYKFRMVPPPIIRSANNFIYSIWYLSNILIYVQQDALHSLFLSGNCSTCFGWYLHPSSGAQTTIYSTWYLSDRYCYLLLQRQVAVTV